MDSNNHPLSPKLNSIETMNDILGSGYQIVSLGEMEPVVLSKLPNEDLAQKEKEQKKKNEENHQDNSPSSSPPPLPEKTTDDYIFQFYLGSLTVVGLFILFRMIQKSK